LNIASRVPVRGGGLAEFVLGFEQRLLRGVHAASSRSNFNPA
jgi:hypothetical protein